MADEIKIESGIPMPGRSGGVTKYPIREMQVGDSFFVAGMQQSTRAGVSSLGRRYDMKLASRSVTENGVKGIRIWRVA